LSGPAKSSGPAVSPAPDDSSRRHSLIRYSPALVLVAVMIFDSSRIADGDLWAHLRFGQEILRAGHLPLRDPYAYSAPGRLWISHEWLSEAIIAFCYTHAGVIGLKLMKLSCSAAVVICLALAMEETGAPTIVQFAILIIMGVRLAPAMQFRPQIFTYALLAATIALLSRDCFRGRAPLWPLIPAFALWANLHGGFVAGLAALGAYIVVVGAMRLAQSRDYARVLRLAAIGIACLLATVLTPYGIGTWTTVLHTIGSPRMIGIIDEWKPLLPAVLIQWRAAHGSIAYNLPIFMMYAGLLAALIIAPRGGDAPLLAIAAIMIAASFMAVRNVPLGLIAAAAPLARHAMLASRIGEAAGTRAEQAPLARAGWLNQMALAAMAIIVAAQTGLFSNRLRLDHSYPAGAVAFMRQHAIGGNILCHYGWSGYVIYHCAPPSRVFIDSRFEMIYPRSVANDFIGFVLNRNAAAVLAKYPHDLVLAPPGSPESRVMVKAAGWKLIYRDQDSALFARADSAAAKISGAPVNGAAPPDRFP
jgi:hypothetical protein